MAISNREFVAGTRISVKFRGVVHTAEAFAVEGKEKLSWRIVEPADFVAPVDAETDKGLSGGEDRKTFQSIGDAMMAMFGKRTGPNRYSFWTLESEFNPETAHDYGVRTVNRTGEPKPKAEPKPRKQRTVRSGEEPKVKRGRKPKAEPTAAVTAGDGYLPIHKLEGDETTWFCDGCMAPFEEIAGVVPEVCPNGHTNESLKLPVEATETTEPVTEPTAEAEPVA